MHDLNAHLVSAEFVQVLIVELFEAALVLGETLDLGEV